MKKIKIDFTMLYKKWEFFYNKIAKDFSFQLENEKKAACTLDNILEEKKENILSEENLKKLINNKEVIIFGAGPNLEETILKNENVLGKKVKITADGATTALLQKNIQPDIIVTDLDGEISDQIKANKQGSITIIHTHGDNIDNINKYVPKFKGKILGTTQIDPESYDNLHNYGGFTDGDRSVFLADHFNAKKIYLAGFDFDGIIGKYSFAANKDKNLKLKKLEWCEYLIDILKKEKPRIEYLGV